MSGGGRLRWAFAAGVLGLFGAALAMLWSGGREAIQGAIDDGPIGRIFFEPGPVGGVSSRPVTVSGSGHVSL
jgi:hypothetical protein